MYYTPSLKELILINRHYRLTNYVGEKGSRSSDVSPCSP